MTHGECTGTTRRTRTPAFWDTPAAPWLPILVIHIRSQVKTRQSQIDKFKNIATNSNFEFLQEPLHGTHPLKLLHKMYIYIWNGSNQNCRCYRADMGCGTDGRTDRRTDEVKPIYPQELCCAWGIKMQKSFMCWCYIYMVDTTSIVTGLLHMAT